MTTGRKYSEDKFFTKITHTAASGVVGQDEYKVFGEIKLRVVADFTTSGTLTIQGRIKHSTTWDAIGTLTFAGDTDSFEIDTYDYIRFNFTVAAGSTGEISASGFYKASAAAGGSSFTTIQADAGTSPVAESAADTLTITSSDSSVTVTGNSTTDTIDLTGAGSPNLTDATATNSATTTVPLTINQIASNTAVALQVKDSGGTIQAEITSGGDFAFGSGGNLQAQPEATFNNLTHPFFSMHSSAYAGVTAGNKSIRFNNNGVGTESFHSGYKTHNGTIGTPAYRLTGVNNTGFYYNTTATEWAFSRSSTDSMWFNANGIAFQNIPTSDSGLITGQAYDDFGTLKIKGTAKANNQSIETVTTTATLDDTQSTVLADATGGAFTITLPAASSSTGRIYTIKKIDATATVTVDGNASETIDGATTNALATQYDSITIHCNGTAWFIL